MTKENFWLMKSEPEAYSIDTLKKEEVTLCKHIMLHKKLKCE